MASSTQSSSEEQFLCSICLEVFSEPISTPCGHNFCKRCISQTWDTNKSCFCPLCKEVFSTRPHRKGLVTLIGYHLETTGSLGECSQSTPGAAVATIVAYHH
uniref:RING-type domain-containing protein n=1 Tax=Neogobius melanostomus TaxID=47308 RepID=A0A8C6V257_9GOBI